MKPQIISDKLVEKLAGHYEFPAISILMPTHKSSPPPHLTEDTIRLKNNITEVKHKLEEANVDKKLQSQMLHTLEELLEDKSFIRHQSYGLALFMTKDETIPVSLPYSIENHVVVNESFHISPLLTMMQENYEYSLLQLSDKNPRLFEGDLYQLKEIDADMPKDRNEALNISDFEQEQQHHVGTGDGFAVFHGHAHDEDKEGKERQEYYRILTNIIRPHISKKKPLILAGTKRDITMFNDVSKLQNIAQDSIEQSIEHKNIADIHELAQEVLKRWSTDEAYKARTRFKQLLANNPSKAIHDLNNIMTAAAEGRVAQLLVRIKKVTKDAVQSGIADRTVISHEGIDAEPLDQIAIGTWAQSGTIHAIDSSLMPTTAPLAAILRY